jgi:hypothetical protein
MLRGWLADEARLRELAVRLDAIAAEPGEPAGREARMAEATAEALEAWLDQASRERLSSRLLAVAIHLAGMGLHVPASRAAAASRALAAGAPGAAIPFARQMVEKAFPSRGASPAAAPVIAAPRR